MLLNLSQEQAVTMFSEMRAELLRILETLDASGWDRPTACDGWSVKDVALHLLADDIGYLSRHRDNDGITFVTDSFDELVALINQQNEIWVHATRRMSRTLLLMFLKITGKEMMTYLQSVDFEQKIGPIAWASNHPALMHLQIARELTEYWMHHQHICDALGITSLKDRRFLHLMLSTFAFALPRTYSKVLVDEGTAIALEITGEAADTWYLQRENATWILKHETSISPDAIITMSDDTAWRMYTKGISRTQLEAQSSIQGDRQLALPLFDTIAILA